MALEKDFELLDDYLANRLSAEEKASFERQMDADPELKREFNIQQKLVEGIKQARLAELKGMLNNIPIPPAPGGQALLVKLGIVAVVAGLVATGIYFFYNKEHNDVKPELQTIAEETPSAPQPQGTETVSEPEKKEVPQEETPAVTEKASPTKEKKNTATTRAKSSTDKQTEETAQPKKPEAFDPSAEAEDAQPDNETILKGYARVSNGSSIGIESITDNKKYDFHYQFKGGKLLLYGQTFREKTMYEILEFFVDKKRTTVILFHENSYYLLKEENEDIKQLKPITDPALLNKLKEYRGK